VPKGKIRRETGGDVRSGKNAILGAAWREERRRIRTPARIEGSHEATIFPCTSCQHVLHLSLLRNFCSTAEKKTVREREGEQDREREGRERKRARGQRGRKRFRRKPQECTILKYPLSVTAHSYRDT